MKTVSRVITAPVESGKETLLALLPQYGLKLAPDGVHIQWALGNCRHPRNWSLRRKVYDTTLIIFLESFTYEVPWFGSYRG